MLTLYFSDGRFDVMTAPGGADGVMVARRHRPDAVLLDIFMPKSGMDGVEARRAIRALDPNIAVVMVTANANESVGRDTLRIGAFDYVPKPFDFEVLDRIVMAAAAFGAAGVRSPFGVNRAAAQPRALTAEEIAAFKRNDVTPMRRAAN